jgi:hypothetical protein
MCTLVQVIGRTTGIIVGTILIPVPILGSVVGGLIGAVSGKMIGGLSGMAISKVLEVYEKQNQEKIDHMKTVPSLMAELSAESQFFQVLTTLVFNPEQAARTETISDSSVLYPLFEQLLREYSRLARDECQMATQLSETTFADPSTFEYFALVPVPDKNSPEEFASTVDLLVLQWPVGQPQPWNNNEEEHVLDISDLNTESKFVE